MISTCPEFRVASTSFHLILSSSPRSTENSHVSVTNDFPVANFRVRLFVLVLLILAASFDMDGCSFRLKTLSSFGFQDIPLSVLDTPLSVLLPP